MVSGKDNETDQLVKYVIEFPKQYMKNLGNNTLIIDINLNLTNNEAITEKFEYEPRPEKFVGQPHTKTWYEAEKDCVSQGGHLPSVHSIDENNEVGNTTTEEFFWIGGRKVNDEWTWSDGSESNYTKWNIGSEQPNTLNDFVILLVM